MSPEERAQVDFGELAEGMRSGDTEAAQRAVRRRCREIGRRTTPKHLTLVCEEMLDELDRRGVSWRPQ